MSKIEEYVAIDKNIDRILNNEKIRSILISVGKSKNSPLKRVSNLIGEIYTYCLVQNDGSPININDAISYVELMRDAYFECQGLEELMLNIRAKELCKSIIKRLNIDVSDRTVSKEDVERIKDYFLKNYVVDGYVFHSFSGALEDSIREFGLSSTKRIWDNDDITRIAHIFEGKNVISPFGGYSHYNGGGLYIEHDPKMIYWHALSAPEWFNWFTSSNHNKNSSNIEESPYYLRDYDGCRQNVLDLCINAELSENEIRMVMELFESIWKVLCTKKMCVALIPKKIIGMDNPEIATIPGQTVIEMIKTVLSDRRGQYGEHKGNVLKNAVTEKDMLVMSLPSGQEIFGNHAFSRETKEKLYDPRLVLAMIYRGTKTYGFELSEEKINSIIETLRKVHNDSPEVDRAIQEYNTRLSEHEF